MIYLNNYEIFTIKMRFKKIYKDMKMYRPANKASTYGTLLLGRGEAAVFAD